MRRATLRVLSASVLLGLALAQPGAAHAASQDILTPGAFDFGSVTVGQSVSEYFLLKNVSGQPFRITAVALRGWPGSLTLALPVTLQPGEIVVAGPITFEPAATGRYSSAIEFTTTHPSWPLAVVPVSGRALAASPSIAAIPSVFDFGTVTVGQPATEHFQLRNVSGHPVTITAAALSGWPGFPGALAFALPVTLQPGETVGSGSLTFMPTAAGWHSTDIELTTDDPGSSLVVVPIRGAGALPGASPSIIATPGVFDFGYVTVGQSVSEVFQLGNASARAVAITAAALPGWPGSLPLPLPLTLQPGEILPVGPLSFAPAATGPYSSAVELTTDDPSWPLALLPLSGKALAASPSIVSVPRAFDFGYVTVGSSASRDFPLRNASNHAVTITGAALTGRPGFPGDLAPLALPLTLQPGEAVAAGPLTFRPAATGWHSSAIELTTDDPSSSLVAIPVSAKAAFPAELTRGPVPPVVAYGARVTLTGTLTSASGTTLAGRAVVLETSANGSPWSRDAQVFTASTGTFTLSSPLLFSAAYVRVEFEGDSEWAPALSEAALVKPTASLGVPVSPATMSRLKTYTVHGSLRPAHTPGAVAGTLYCQRLENGRWVTRQTFATRAYVHDGQDRYQAEVRLPLEGSWRMRAYHADAGHAATYSGWRSVMVR